MRPSLLAYYLRIEIALKNRKTLNKEMECAHAGAFI